MRWRVTCALVGVAVAVGGALVALVAPGAWFDVVLVRFIGIGGTAHTSAAQRAIACCGALTGGVAVAALGRAPYARLAAVNRARLAFGGLAAGLLVAENVVLTTRLLVVTRAMDFAISALLVVSSVTVVASSSSPIRRPWLATGAGLGYGCFSALWHCCAPLWTGDGSWDLWLLALALVMGAIGRVAASLRSPIGESLGAIVFALVYPWHTPLWSAQCLLGGAFATALVRVTASGFAPVLFLGCAYVSHMTLPFLGIGGILLAAAATIGHAIAASRSAQRGGLTPSRPAAAARATGGGARRTRA